MHTVGEPGYGRLGFDDFLRFGMRGLAGVCEALHVGFDGVDTRHILSGRDDGVDKFAAFPAFRISCYRDSLRCRLGQRLEIPDSVRMPGNAFPWMIAQYRFNGWNGWVIIGIGPENKIICSTRVVCKK